MLLSLIVSIGAIMYVSSFDVPEKIMDFIHLRVPFGVVPSEAAHIICGATAVCAYLYNPRHFYSIFKNVYLKGMVIKATLIVFTLMPDANPECGKLSLTRCLTRNDMLPSGHMLVALSSGLVLGKWSLVTIALSGFLLVASHMHYCVDVILSCWLVYFLERDRLAVENGFSLSSFSGIPDSFLKATR